MPKTNLHSPVSKPTLIIFVTIAETKQKTTNINIKLYHGKHFECKIMWKNNR